VDKEMVEVPKKLVKLIHKLAQKIKMKHGGWYESYAMSDEVELVKYSDLLKGQKNGQNKS
jgi:hypothetical protein